MWDLSNCSGYQVCLLIPCKSYTLNSYMLALSLTSDPDLGNMQIHCCLGRKTTSCIWSFWSSRWIRVLVFACQQEETCILLYWCWICILEIGTAFISENFLYSNENYRHFFTELGWVCFQSKSNPSPTWAQPILNLNLNPILLLIQTAQSKFRLSWC